MEDNGAASFSKTITIIANGNSQKSFTVQLRLPITLTEIAKAAESKWAVKYRNIRLFNSEGVEYFEDDIRYIRDHVSVYISKGQEFDANSSYGEYEILRSLGEGGFGKVNLGRHKNTGELVAIKTMKANKIRNAHDIDTVFREVENLKALNHPNIIKIHNCYTLKEMQVVVIMEYVDGGELLQYLKKKQKLSFGETLLFFRKIVSAIDYCHSKNIVHRDLKLQNILIKNAETQDIKVADFGISGVAEQFNPDVDTGTLKYMAPEVLSGNEKGNSPGVDIWALGCIFYYLICGRLPFIGKTSSQTIKLIKEGAYRLPKGIQSEQQSTLILSRMLDVNPKTRIKIVELNDFLEELTEKPRRTLMTMSEEESSAGELRQILARGMAASSSGTSMYTKVPHLAQQGASNLVPKGGQPQNSNNHTPTHPKPANREERKSSPLVQGYNSSRKSPLYSKKNLEYPSLANINRPSPQYGGIVPKRLQKEKDIIENQLKEYQNRKKASILSQSSANTKYLEKGLFRSSDKVGTKSQQAGIFNTTVKEIPKFGTTFGDSSGFLFGVNSKIKMRETLFQPKNSNNR